MRFAPKLPVGWIVQLYRRDALGIQDQDLLNRVGFRLSARCRDVVMISDSRLACPECGTEFGVQWIGQAADHLERCAGCGWAITAGAFHASFEHQDLLGTNARSAFVEFCEQYPVAGSYQERMLAIDRLVHAVRRTGNLAARNLIEGRPRQVLAVLDELSRS